MTEIVPNKSAAPEVGEDTAGGGGRKPSVRLLVGFGIIGPLTIHLILPSLPYLEGLFDTDYATIQLLVSFYVIAFGTAQLFIGPLSDMIGRRKTLIGGLLLYTVSSALCAAAPNFETLLALRLVQAVGACVGVVLARAIIRDNYDARQSTRLIGYLSMGAAIGPMLAPVFGGFLFEFVGWRGLFAILATIGAASTVLAWTSVAESGVRRTGSRRLRQLLIDIAALARDSRFLLNSMNISFNTGMFYAFVVGGPYLASEFLQMAPKTYGAWFASAALGYAGGNFAAGRLSNHFRGESVTLVGAAATFFFTLILLAVLALELHSPLAIFSAVSAATFASGLVMPTSYSAALSANPELTGSASGFAGFLQFSLAAVFSAVAGIAIEAFDHPAALGAVMVFATGAGLITSTASVLIRRR